MLAYEEYIERFEEDTKKTKELFYKAKKCKHSILLLKRYKRNNKNKEVIDNRLKLIQKDLFLIKRYLLRIYARTIGYGYKLNDPIIDKRMRVLASQPINLF